MNNLQIEQDSNEFQDKNCFLIDRDGEETIAYDTVQAAHDEVQEMANERNEILIVEMNIDPHDLLPEP